MCRSEQETLFKSPPLSRAPVTKKLIAEQRSLRINQANYYVGYVSLELANNHVIDAIQSQETDGHL